MDDRDFLLQRFAHAEPRLRAVAYRMLGSATDTDDAIQETWLRLSRADADSVDNLLAWLTTVVARVCLNMLRARGARREQPLDLVDVDQIAGAGAVPEDEVVLADSVGLALLVVLDMLTPAERLAFVLHDMFDLPFEEIAAIVGRSPAAARQLASRARRRVRGAHPARHADLQRQRRVVDAYLAAIRAGDFEALVSLLDPDVVLRADGAATPNGKPAVLRGADAVVGGALASSPRARYAAPALVDGSVGIVMAPLGRLFLVLSFAFAGDAITEIDVIADPGRLHELDLAVAD
jgi:RNA polymerase sigma-70 factor (ECF subfamily)